MNDDLEIHDPVGAVEDVREEEGNEGEKKKEEVNEVQKEVEPQKKREKKKKDKKNGKKKKSKDNKVVPVTETPGEDKEESELNNPVENERQASSGSVRESSPSALKSGRKSKVEDTVIDIEEENITKSNEDKELPSSKEEDTGKDLSATNDASKPQGSVETKDNTEESPRIEQVEEDHKRDEEKDDAPKEEEREPSAKKEKSKKLRKSRTGESLVVSDLAQHVVNAEDEKETTRRSAGERGMEDNDNKDKKVVEDVNNNNEVLDALSENSSEDKEERSSSRQSVCPNPDTNDVRVSQRSVRSAANGRRSEVGKTLSNESRA